MAIKIVKNLNSVCRLQAEQSARVITIYFKCATRKTIRTRIRFNTNRMVDRKLPPLVIVPSSSDLSVHHGYWNCTRHTGGTRQRRNNANYTSISSQEHRMSSFYKVTFSKITTVAYSTGLQRQNRPYQQWRNKIFYDERRYCISRAYGRTSV